MYATKLNPSRERLFRPSVGSYGLATRSAYGDVGDKELDYLVTRDGEVYWWRYSGFGFGRLWGGKVVYLYYSALTGNEPKNDLFQTAIEGDAAETVLSKVVGSWNDYDTAKIYAKRLIETSQKKVLSPTTSGSGGALSPTPSSSAGTQGEGGKGKGEDDKKMSPWLIGGLVAGGVVLLGGVVYFSQKSGRR